ncbi:KxYKxGKxW signal peptide domain-containing protein [Clostridium sp. YIM B02515]|uniref:KxYKxGKxW signal peptide domain-containing protein n=1 Tax=Clostridium rhizosphaerae TaxID=2803861 RepID=A0ABS1TDL6_9CLOT|nr:KxYKxGKxW signal peptide domain-containing protein [Clostridium rhizosphaerae]
MLFCKNNFFMHKSGKRLYFDL